MAVEFAIRKPIKISNMKLSHSLLFLLFIAVGHVQAQAEKIGPLPASPPILTADNIDLNAAFFFKEWASHDKLANARAGLYLLGVADSSEGKSWCGYGRIKVDTMNEYVFLHFRNMVPEKMKTVQPWSLKKHSPKIFPVKNETSLSDTQAFPLLVAKIPKGAFSLFEKQPDDPATPTPLQSNPFVYNAPAATPVAGAVPGYLQGSLQSSPFIKPVTQRLLLLHQKN